jgi:hypothetical protein
MYAGNSVRAKILLATFLAQGPYDKVWHLEHDIEFTGNWTTFFKHAADNVTAVRSKFYDAVRSIYDGDSASTTAEEGGKPDESLDFLFLRSATREDIPHWYHWKVCKFCDTVPLFTNRKTMLMATRLSQKLGTLIWDGLFSNRLIGHHEAIIHTLCASTSW